MSENYCVYKHTSPNGKSYIGQTGNYQRRCNGHRSGISCPAFSSAIKKYGWDNFTHEILIDELSINDANDWEKFYIFIFNSIAPNGYNLRSGGDNSTHSEYSKLKMSIAQKGKVISEETREKIRKTLVGKNTRINPPRIKMTEERRKIISEQLSERNRTRIVTKETREKIGASSKGRIPNEETKKKISESLKGKEFSLETRKKISDAKKNQTEETRRKISESHKGKKVSDETKEKIRQNSLLQWEKLRREKELNHG